MDRSKRNAKHERFGMVNRIYPDPEPFDDDRDRQSIFDGDPVPEADDVTDEEIDHVLGAAPKTSTWPFFPRKITKG